MHTRAELFWRFLKRRLNRSTDLEKGRKEGKSSNEPKGDESTINDPLLNEQQEFESEESRKMYLEKMEKQREERDRKLDLVLNRSGLNTRMQVFCTFFFKLFFLGIVRKICTNGTILHGQFCSKSYFNGYI